VNLARSRFLPLVLTLVAALACGDGRRVSGATPSSIGPDALLLRVPSAGGIVRAHRVGSDSVLWSARARVAPLAAALGFDDFQGALLLQERTGKIAIVDLRLGTVETISEERLGDDAVAEGAAVFGLVNRGSALRLTAVGPWNWRVPGGANKLIPNPDGSLMLLSDVQNGTMLRRLIPPETNVVDSTIIPSVRLAARTPIGDRVYFATDSGLIAVLARDLSRVLTLNIRDSVVALVSTPSGDRVFVATPDDRLRIIDRYAEEERGSVELPGPATDLRMDADGNYLLARAHGVDSVYVISIGTARVVNTIATRWRADLPVVAPEGRILLADGGDAVLIDAESGRVRLRYQDGASELWTLVRWNGFRPRAVGLDRPVQFEEYAADSAAADSALAAMVAARYGDLSGVARAAPLPTPAPATPAPNTQVEPPQRPRDAATRGTWTVSFATLLDEARARSLADSIVVGGRRARMVVGSRDGVTVYRVLLGPFDSREQAERAGMTSRLSYWVFEGAP
jgi:hypothetical protein